MCFVHGLSDGRYLLDEEFLKPEDARDAGCTCGHEHSHEGATRRQALSRGALGAGAAILGSTMLGKAVLPSSAGAVGPTSGDRVVMIGANGGPLLAPLHKQRTIALHVTGKNDNTYLIDCGYDTANQMLAAQLKFSQLRHVFVTHGHSDHVSGYAPLALHSLIGNIGTGGIRRLDFWGPKPMEQMQRDLFRSYKVDIESRKFSGSPDLRKLLHSHQYTLPKRGVRKV